MKNLVAVVGLMIVGFFAWKANGQGLANVTLESGLPVTGSLLPTSNTYGGNLQARSIYTDGAGNIFLAGSATRTQAARRRAFAFSRLETGRFDLAEATGLSARPRRRGVAFESSVVRSTALFPGGRPRGWLLSIGAAFDDVDE